MPVQPESNGSKPALDTEAVLERRAFERHLKWVTDTVILCLITLVLLGLAGVLQAYALNQRADRTAECINRALTAQATRARLQARVDAAALENETATQRALALMVLLRPTDSDRAALVQAWGIWQRTSTRYTDALAEAAKAPPVVSIAGCRAET